VNCRSSEYKIGVVETIIGRDVYAMHFSLFCISYVVTTTSRARCIRSLLGSKATSAVANHRPRSTRSNRRLKTVKLDASTTELANAFQISHWFFPYCVQLLILILYCTTTYSALLFFIQLEMHVRLICAIKFYLLTYLNTVFEEIFVHVNLRESPISRQYLQYAG